MAPAVTGLVHPGGGAVGVVGCSRSGSSSSSGGSGCKAVHLYRESTDGPASFTTPWIVNTKVRLGVREGFVTYLTLHV